MEFRMATFSLTVWTLLLTIDVVNTQLTEGSCPSGQWGLYCNRECHCIEGSCKVDTGQCANERCSPGWTQPPTCQVPCTRGTFGLRCSLACHCPEGDTCNHVNGLCSSATCHYGWDGAGCQIQLPVFKTAPNVTLNIDDITVKVTWRPWSPTLDTGDPPVAQYTLEYSVDDKEDWHVATKINATSNKHSYYYVMRVVMFKKYSFRLLVSRFDNQKLRPSIAGPKSAALIICQRPSNPPILMQVSPQAKSEESGVLLISWQAPPDGSHNCHLFMKYVVKIWCDVPEKCTSRESIIPSFSKKFTTTELPVDAMIFVQVIAVNDAGLRSIPSNMMSVVIRAIIPTNGESSLPITTVLRDAKVSVQRDTSSLLTFYDSNYNEREPTQYKVTLHIIETYLTSITPSTKTIFSGTQPVPLERLKPSSRYKVTVEKMAKTERIIANCSTTFWTPPTAPEFRDELIVDSVDNDAINLRVPKIDTMADGSVKGLVIFVQAKDGEHRQPAEVQDFVSVIREEKVDHNGELVVGKVIPAQDLYHRHHTVPIDGNVKFEKGKLYDLWYCVQSSAGDKSRSTCKPVRYTNVERTCNSIFTFGRKSDEECSKFNSHIGFVFLGLFIFILIIILILMTIYLKRHDLRKLTSIICCPTRRTPTFGSTSFLVSCDRMNTTNPDPASPFKTFSCLGPTTVDDIEIFLKRNQMANILFKDYFSQLPKNKLYVSDEGQKIENSHLNRSSLFLPYDKNRVQLPMCEDSGTDYINASVVKVMQGRTYIVSEAPTTVTAQRFWLMVWHYNVERVIMLVDVHEKIEPPCELYWNDEKIKTYGDIRVTLLSLRRYANYNIRVMELAHRKQKVESVRIIHHYQYKNWNTTENIPASVTTFAEFVEVSGSDCNPGAMCAVHCEYGTGRSGMFMLSEVLRNEAVKKGCVDVYATAMRVCTQRGSLISNPHQYRFIHCFLAESVLHRRSNLKAREFLTYYKEIIIEGEKTKLVSEFKDLEGFEGRREPSELSNRFVSPYTSPKVSHPMNMASWRKRNLEFIELDSYLTLKGLLVSVSLYDTRQIPRLLQKLWESETTTIVTFGHNDESTRFWPGSDLEKTYDSVGLSVATTQLMRHNDFMIRELALTKHQGHLRPQRLMRQFHYTPWPWEKPLPETRSFAKLVKDVAAWWSQSSPSYAPVYVQCSDGYYRSGAFCVLWKVWERLLTEGKINLYQAVKTAREAHPDFVTTIEQYKLCYRVAKTMAELKAMEEQMHSSLDSLG